MAVKHELRDGKLFLEIDNGDLVKLDQAMEKWSFKDYQSLLRFSISLLILNEDKSFSIKMDGSQSDVAPAAHSLK